MKKIIASIAAVIVVALLGIVGVNIFKGTGPRERVSSPDGSKIIVEELSYYIKGHKAFGKVYKPADEQGNFPDSLGSLPGVIFIHEPLKTNDSEQVLKQLTDYGLVGYDAALHGNEKYVSTLAKRFSKEKFVEEDLVFIIADSYSSEAAVGAAAKMKDELAGLILINPEVSGKALKSVSKLDYEVLTLDSATGAAAKTAGYLETRGALK